MSLELHRVLSRHADIQDAADTTPAKHRAERQGLRQAHSRIGEVGSDFVTAQPTSSAARIEPLSELDFTAIDEQLRPVHEAGLLARQE
jgi:hypothetical protein